MTSGPVKVIPPALARFALGQIVSTANALSRLRTEGVLTALRRHAQGDWDDLCPEDAIANDIALQQGSRLLSAYGFGQDRFWVATLDQASPHCSSLSLSPCSRPTYRSKITVPSAGLGRRSAA